MTPAFAHRRRVAFSETDAAGILHFSRTPVWLEDCEHAFLRSLGTSVHLADALGPRLFPRVHVDVDYAAPLRFEEEAEVRLWVASRSDKRVTYRFEVVRAADGTRCSVGTVVTVCARAEADSMRAAPLPASLATALDAAAARQDPPPETR